MSRQSDLILLGMWVTFKLQLALVTETKTKEPLSPSQKYVLGKKPDFVSKENNWY